MLYQIDCWQNSGSQQKPQTCKTSFFPAIYLLFKKLILWRWLFERTWISISVSFVSHWQRNDSQRMKLPFSESSSDQVLRYLEINSLNRSVFITIVYHVYFLFVCFSSASKHVALNNWHKRTIPLETFVLHITAFQLIQRTMYVIKAGTGSLAPPNLW